MIAMSQSAVEQLLQKGLLDEAITTCQAILQVTPTNTKVLAYLGLAYFRKQDFESAIPYFQKAGILDSKFVEAGLKHAQCLDRLRRYAEAYDVAEKWYRIQPSHVLLRGLVEQLKPYSKSATQGWERTQHLSRKVHFSGEE